jgi:hypothetical protein
MQAVDYTHQPADIQMLALHLSYNQSYGTFQQHQNLDLVLRYFGILRLLQLLKTAQTPGYVFHTRLSSKSDQEDLGNSWADAHRPGRY